jgi:hypothetical protein
VTAFSEVRTQKKGAGQALIVLLAVWWSWNYTTWTTNDRFWDSCCVCTPNTHYLVYVPCPYRTAGKYTEHAASDRASRLFTSRGGLV